VGYARKSPSNEDIDTRIRLLQAMVNNLNERSYAQIIYVSSCSHSSLPFFERDLKTDGNIMDELHNVNGNTQGKIKTETKNIYKF
jgi:hypothetical protein